MSLYLSSHGQNADVRELTTRERVIYAGGTCTAASAARVFVPDPSRLLIEAEVLTKRVQFTLDTGAVTTDLNANFADLFPDVLQRDGKRGRQNITGAGGTQTFDSFELP